jgi:hypothetical protein
MDRRPWLPILGAAVVVVLGLDISAALLRSSPRTSHPAAVHEATPSAPATPSPPQSPTALAAPAVRVLEADSPLTAAAVPRPAEHAQPVALLIAPHVISPTVVAQLSRLSGARTISVGVATFGLGGQQLSVLSVDPASLRSVAPAPSADSDALWAALARGDLAASYEGKAAKLGVLGGDVDATAGSTSVRMRLGARAGFGLVDADLIVSPQRGVQISVVPGTGLLLAAAPGTSPAIVAQQLAPIAKAAGIGYALMGPAAADTTVAGGGTWQGLFQRAATTCSGMPWQVLAAIGQIESDDGRNNGPSSAGAVGPMQFLPSTFAAVAVDGDHDGKASPWDPYDAVYTAARLLCRDGAGSSKTLAGAVFAYNHAQWYVDEVLALAARY